MGTFCSIWGHRVPTPYCKKKRFVSLLFEELDACFQMEQFFLLQLSPWSSIYIKSSFCVSVCVCPAQLVSNENNRRTLFNLGSKAFIVPKNNVLLYMFNFSSLYVFAEPFFKMGRFWLTFAIFGLVFLIW